jgi:hypothetical protein
MTGFGADTGHRMWDRENLKDFQKKLINILYKNVGENDLKKCWI